MAQCTSEYCRRCSTPEARRAMCEENLKNNPNHKCSICKICNCPNAGSNNHEPSCDKFEDYSTSNDIEA